MNIKAASLTPEQALAELEARYEASVTALRKAIGDYIDHNTLPDTRSPRGRSFCLSAAVGLLGRRRS
ncbi:AMP nucleosidase [Klebsiella pneumoniae]|uniref:AMP nucleosidase n=1 Tax=Klebsiella pneumoniae TaxID=573 RepID=A0A377WKP9_KLEPN|nr:AMP nucleosidase [Klebsiella pneumoniae]